MDAINELEKPPAQLEANQKELHNRKRSFFDMGAGRRECRSYRSRIVWYGEMGMGNTIMVYRDVIKLFK